MPLINLRDVDGQWPRFIGRRVLCHGCFDILHIGHIRHFRAAKALGDMLFVTVTPDKAVEKGLGRPLFTAQLRAEAIAALRCVDYVAISEWPSAVEVISILRPHIYTKGGDYIGKMTPALEEERCAVETYGGKLVFTDEQAWHSTDILEAIKNEKTVPFH